jgi:MFS family permease
VTAADRPRAAAIAVVFVANGLGGPSFLPRLPERQAALGLSDAGLGLALAGMAVGALAASPVAGRLVGRVGSRRVVVASALALGASLWTAGAAPSAAPLFGALAVVGAADASMDIAMNANGAAYEAGSGRSVMHRLHGAWSLGALGAAGMAAAAAGLGVPLTAHLAVIGVAIATAAIVARPRLVVGDAVPVPVAPASERAQMGHAVSADRRRVPRSWRFAPGRSGHGPARRRGLSGDGDRARAGTRWWPLVVLGGATVAGAVLEGAPVDWSAIRLERLGTGPGVAALGTAAFMAGMLAGRALGDALTDRFGGAVVLRGGMALAAAGLAVGVAVDHPLAFAVGLVVAGVGASGFFPLAFSAAARTPGVAPGAGVATVSLAARLGFLVEPLLMGALAEAVTVRWAYAVVAGVAVALAVAAPRVVPAAARPVDAPVADVRLP